MILMLKNLEKRKLSKFYNIFMKMIHLITQNTNY